MSETDSPPFFFEAPTVPIGLARSKRKSPQFKRAELKKRLEQAGIRFRLKTITLENLPQHIQEGFSKLDLPKELQALLMVPFRPAKKRFSGFLPPKAEDAPEFWQALERALHLQRGSRGTRYEGLSTRELFKRVLVEKLGTDFPGEWLAAGAHAALCFHRIRQHAESITDSLSGDLRRRYFGGQKPVLKPARSGKGKIPAFDPIPPEPQALVEAIRYGLVSEPWVASEVARLQVLRFDPTATRTRRQQAAELCREIGKALAETGRGHQRQRTTTEQQSRERALHTARQRRYSQKSRLRKPVMSTH